MAQITYSLKYLKISETMRKKLLRTSNRHEQRTSSWHIWGKISKIQRVGKMGWWVKALATKTDDLSSIPGTHMVKKKINKKLTPAEYPSISTHIAETYAYSPTHIYNKKEMWFKTSKETILKAIRQGQWDGSVGKWNWVQAAQPGFDPWILFSSEEKAGCLLTLKHVPCTCVHSLCLSLIYLTQIIQKAMRGKH